MRQGEEWTSYLDFDLGTVSRVSRVTVGRPAGAVGRFASVRAADRVAVRYSRVGGMAEAAARTVEADLDSSSSSSGAVEFDPPVEARWVMPCPANAFTDT